MSGQEAELESGVGLVLLGVILAGRGGAPPAGAGRHLRSQRDVSGIARAKAT
jgi:hypothetical protein